MRNTTSFDDFYRGTSRRLLGYAYSVTGDWGQAQDLVQEAYLRAWRHWGKIEGYDDLEAWLRLVVVRMASDNWRKLLRWRRAIVRNGPIQTDTAPPSEETVLVTRALMQLPVLHRQAVALHYLFDLPIARIAADLDVPEGTVKSWLARGRNALADVLAPASDRKLALSTEVRVTADRRALRRTLAGTTIVAVLVTGIAFAAQPLFTRKNPPVLTPSPSASTIVLPSPSPSPTPQPGPTVRPATFCNDTYPKLLPLTLFPGAMENSEPKELCYHPTNDPDSSFLEGDHLPKPCSPNAHASDARIVDRRGMEFYATELNPDPSATMLDHIVTRYRDGGAADYLQELRNAMDRCGAWTKDKVRYNFTPQISHGIGTTGLVIKMTYTHLQQQESGPNQGYYFFLIEQVGDYIVVIHDRGWEGYPSKDATLIAALARAIAAAKSL